MWRKLQILLQKEANQMSDTLKNNIALSLLPNIGDILAKRLVSYCGSAENVFKEKKSALEKIPGIGHFYATAVQNTTIFKKVEEELKFIEKNNIKAVYYLDKAYPKRLTHCEDGPIVLYYKGNADLNPEKIISIVGTREATDYGKDLTDKLIASIAPYNATIVSGLAYGIDIHAHKAALENKLPTFCALAHGLDKIYPGMHKSVAERILESGAWLSDFTSNTLPNRENFPRRNRIVAGISDATIVIESKENGGSLITADIANSYNRDVFAFPGRVNDIHSIGCNNLIKQNKAALIQSATDVIQLLGWEQTQKTKQTIQKQLFVTLSSDEELLVNLLKDKEGINIDELSLLSKMPMSKVSAVLLTLEFSGIVKSLPGKIYRLN